MKEIPRCVHCGLPQLQVMSCACPVETLFVEEDAHTQIDDACGNTNKHFVHEAWTPGMRISTEHMVTREELQQCRDNTDVLALLFFKGFTNF